MFSKTVLLNVLLVTCGLSVILGTVALTNSRFSHRSPWQLVAINNSSMGGALPDRSLAITKKSTSNLAEKGDLVSFAQPNQKNRTIVHRVEQIINDNGDRLIITKADANPGVDTWLLSDQSITGIYRGHIWLAGSWLNLLERPAGTVGLVIIPGLLIILVELNRLYRSLNLTGSSPAELTPSSV